MDRREFVASSSVALAGLLGTEALAQTPPRKELYDLRLYTLASAQQKQRLETFLKDVGIPAMTRAGAGPIGVFTVLDKPEDLTLYVLITHTGMRSVVGMGERMMQDAKLAEDGKEFFALTSKDKPYERIEGSLLLAFDAIPKIEVPEPKPGRIFELRCYENHSCTAHAKKVEMFNTGGEIAIFRRTGLKPVFFGQMLFGKNLPNLTYMIAFDDMAAHDANWKVFMDDPEWKKLSKDPKYEDTVSKIIRTFLKPTAYSQI